MATETNGCIFRWKIENISYCCLKLSERLESPTFIADALEGTKWYLRLYPMGDTDEKHVSFYLCRRADCSGPEIIEVYFQLAFLDKDGSIFPIKNVLKRGFEKGGGWGFKHFKERSNVFITERDKFLPEDTLTVQCTISNSGETPVKPKLLSALTVFKVNRRSFVWKIGEVSTVKPGVRITFKEDLTEFDLVLNEILDCVKKLDIDIISYDESIKYFSFKTSIINSDGEKEDCGMHEYFTGDITKGVLPIPLFSKMLLENRKRYLPNDVLSLDCEYVSSNGTAFHELCSCGIISSRATKITVQKIQEPSAEKKKIQLVPVLEDLKSMYDEKILSDTELRTTTKNFPAHKNILSARSPVFRRMFSIDMKEKTSGHVDITDLEDDTVQRMLLYIYTDTLEDLQLENISKLYAAADKYEILSLRMRCASFLKDNLCPTKACEVFLLGDQHNDEDLKNAVQDYMFKHEQEVFGSQEWKHFMDTNSKLAANIMFQKYLPK